MKLILWLPERVGFVFHGRRLAIIKLHGVRGDLRQNEHLKSGAP